jgi:hypothetical protein
VGNCGHHLPTMALNGSCSGAAGFTSLAVEYGVKADMAVGSSPTAEPYFRNDHRGTKWEEERRGRRILVPTSALWWVAPIVPQVPPTTRCQDASCG